MVSDSKRVNRFSRSLFLAFVEWIFLIGIFPPVGALILDIVCGILPDSTDLLLTQLPDFPGGRSHIDITRIQHFSWRYQTARGDDHIRMNHGTVQNGGVNTYQDSVVQCTAMDHGVMSNRHIISDPDGVRLMGHMHRCVVWDIGAAPDRTPVHIAACAHIKPCWAIPTDGDIADDISTRSDEHGLSEHGPAIQKFIKH